MASKPKETKVEAEARRAREADAEYAEFVQSYPVRFVALMFNFMDTPGFSVKRVDAETYEFNSNESEWWLRVSPPINRNWETVTAMEDAEHAFAQYAADRAEESRQMMVRSTALAKLTAEERELLGV
jgi:hypothetical protein